MQICKPKEICYVPKHLVICQVWRLPREAALLRDRVLATTSSRNRVKRRRSTSRTTATWRKSQKRACLVNLVRMDTACARGERGWCGCSPTSTWPPLTWSGTFSAERLPINLRWHSHIVDAFVNSIASAIGLLLQCCLHKFSLFMPCLKLVGEKWMSATLESEPDEPFEWDGLPTNSFLVGMSSKFDQVKHSCLSLSLLLLLAPKVLLNYLRPMITNPIPSNQYHPHRAIKTTSHF